jgi:uncharacterized protein (TIGR01732 family)
MKIRELAHPILRTLTYDVSREKKGGIKMGYHNGFALIVVLFILLIIVGAAYC